MSAVWPSSLPQKPLADGFSETAPNLVVRSPMDIGPAKVRRRATAGVTRLQMRFRLTNDQLTTFQAFLHADLQDRALAFTWMHPISGANATFRIVDAPSYEPIGGGLAWKVHVVFEMLP